MASKNFIIKRPKKKLWSLVSMAFFGILMYFTLGLVRDYGSNDFLFSSYLLYLMFLFFIFVFLNMFLGYSIYFFKDLNGLDVFDPFEKIEVGLERIISFLGIFAIVSFLCVDSLGMLGGYTSLKVYNQSFFLFTNLS